MLVALILLSNFRYRIVRDYSSLKTGDDCLIDERLIIKLPI